MTEIEFRLLKEPNYLARIWGPGGTVDPKLGPNRHSAFEMVKLEFKTFRDDGLLLLLLL